MRDMKRKVSHPGIYLKDAIEELGLNQSEFALRSGLSIKNVSTIINGESNITFDVAIKLAAFFNTSVEGWINLQTKYDMYLNEQKMEEEINEEWKIVKSFNSDFLNNYFHIKLDNTKKKEIIIQLRKYLNVGTLVALKQPDMYTFYKTSVKKDLLEKNIIMRNAWISIAEQVARGKSCQTFNKNIILDNLLNLRRLTLEEPNVFQPKLDSLLSSAGIKLVILPYLPNSLVSGVTKWIQNENCVMIAVNDCGKDADKIWFSIFHEIGHAMKNHKRHLTISYEKGQAEDEDEIAANEFAKRLLINETDYHHFIKQNHFDLKSIQLFAMQQQVADFIVLGRLQKDGYVGWDKYQNIKKKYAISL